MLITRRHHLRYMAKLTPVMIIAYVLQVLFYRTMAGPELVQEIATFLGAGLMILVSGFCFYDHYHQIQLKPNFIELSFSPLKIKHEILYSKIMEVKIRPTRFGYGDLEILKTDGHSFKLLHVDDNEGVASFIKKMASIKG